MNKIKNTFRAGFAIAAGLVAMYSCTDTWDNHYDSGQSSLTFNGTTMQALEKAAPDFAKVVEAYGFSYELSSDNTHTVWAPADGSFNLSDYVDANGKRLADSAEVVNNFIKNHVALYALSLTSRDQNFKLLNKKSETMTGDGFFGGIKMDEQKSNMSCQNGILHVIETPSPYTPNLFEMIAEQYKDDSYPDKETLSLYALLYDQSVNKDTLIEEKSVSRGVDEEGNKIWVNKYMERNNTILKSIDAPLYEEDSSFIAILPTAKAWAERYKKAESLLKFNPSEDSKSAGTCDSLTRRFANLFILSDLFYNKKANVNWQDSLKSTDYYDVRRHEVVDWTRHVYYRNQPKVMPEDKGVNDILAKMGDPVECSNGTAYLVDEYPMSLTEQFFKRIDVKVDDYVLNRDEDGYTANINPPTYHQGSYTSTVKNDETGTENVLRQTYRYGIFDRMDNANISVGLDVYNTLSGVYDIYLVTCPLWLKDIALYPDSTQWDLRPYYFNVKIFERYNGTEEGAIPSDIGKFPVPISVQTLVNPNPIPSMKADIFMTSGKRVNEMGHVLVNDTTYLGQYQFKNAYYDRNDYGVIIQINSAASARDMRENNGLGKYSRDMLISSIILKPHEEDAPVEEGEEAKMRKRNQLTTFNNRK